MKETQLPAKPKSTPGPREGAKAAKEQTPEELLLVESDEKASILKPGILVRTAVLIFINLIAIAGVVFLLGKLSQKAQEVSRLRSLQLGVSKGQAFEGLKADVEGAQTKVNKLMDYFPDEQGLIEFVGEIDKLKIDGGVTSFSFVNNEPIKDKTGTLGLPVLIEIRGSWVQIDSTLQKIMSLPYFVRAIQVEASPAENDPSLIDFKFGGFLYVDKNFSQN